MKLELGSICNRSGTANGYFQTLHHKQQRPLLWLFQVLIQSVTGGGFLAVLAQLFYSQCFRRIIQFTIKHF
jgi:hypothetical protein